MELNFKDLVVTMYQTHRLLSDAEGVQILHRPSGAMVKCDTEDTTEENRQQAMLMLTAKVESIIAQSRTRLVELEAIRRRFSDPRSMSEPTGQLPPLKLREPTKTVGCWNLSKEPCSFSIAMYSKPTDEQIANTEALLGWVWQDAGS